MRLFVLAIVLMINLPAGESFTASDCDAICAARPHADCSDAGFAECPANVDCSSLQNELCHCGTTNSMSTDPVTNPCIVCRNKHQTLWPPATRPAGYSATQVCAGTCTEIHELCELFGLDGRIFGYDACTGDVGCPDSVPTTTTTTTTLASPPPPPPSNDDDYTDLYLKIIGPVAGVIVVEVGVLAVSSA